MCNIFQYNGMDDDQLWYRCKSTGSTFQTSAGTNSKVGFSGTFDMNFLQLLALPLPGFLPGSRFCFSHFYGDGTCQNIAAGGEVLAWEPAEHGGGQHRGVFGRSSGFNTNLVCVLVWCWLLVQFAK